MQHDCAARHNSCESKSLSLSVSLPLCLSLSFSHHSPPPRSATHPGEHQTQAELPLDASQVYITEARIGRLRRELELLRKPSPKGMRGGSLRGGVALCACRTGVPGGPILCTGIRFAAFPQVAGPRPFRSRDRVSPGGAQGISQGGIEGGFGGPGEGILLPIWVLT